MPAPTDARDEREGLFVLSLPRTGSTLLRLLLDTHPQIWAPDELELGTLCSSFVFTLRGLWESNEDGSESPAFVETRRTLSRLLAEQLRERQKDLWCEKSPRNLDHVEVLKATFPTARWVILHRHPFDTIASWLDSSRHGVLFGFLQAKISARPGNFVVAMAEAWVEKTEELLAFEAENRRCVQRLRYEDLVTFPARTATDLFGFLGRLEQGAGVTDKIFTSAHHQRTRRGGDINAYFSERFSTRRIGRGNKIPWKRIESLPDALRQRLNGLLEELGYPEIDFTRPGYDVGVETPGEDPEAGRDDPCGQETTPSRFSLPAFFEGLLPEHLAKVEGHRALGSFLFDVSGASGGLWLVELEQYRSRVVATTEGDHGSLCRIRIDDLSLERILTGRAQAALLFRQGDLRIEGDFETTNLRALQTVFRAAAETET